MSIREPQSEDCLHLNVFAPNAAERAPVMVFFFGGNFNQGAASLYDARRLSEAGGVIVVTVNYRLGALGFMVDSALDAALGVPSGNMGFRDQQASLAWVHDNIAVFGGDAGNVTLFGESAGAVSTCLHAFAADSRKLAHKFILESGACLAVPILPMTRSSVAWLGARLLRDLCARAVDKVACLRALPAEQIAAWTNTTAASDPGPDPLGQQFWPQMDGAVFADYPKRLAARGDFNHGPVLIGTAAHEADFYRTVGATKLDSAAALGLYMLSAYPTSWPALYALYTPASDAAANDSWERLTTDTWFRCPSRTLARALTAHGSQVYLYSFELAPAVHTQELDYVFDGPFVGPILTAPPLTASAPVPPHPGLVRRVQAYWTAFARTGDPNHDGGPAWPRYALATDPHLVLDDTISTGEGLDRQACDAWDRASASAPN